MGLKYVISAWVIPPRYVVELVSLAGFNMDEWLHIIHATHFPIVIVPDNSLVVKKGYSFK